MSEQKYYVRLSCCAYINQKDGCVLHKVLWLDCDWEFVEEDNRHLFTKSELSKIMDGALYRGHETNMDCVFSGCEEWINPLIELVPVEDNE